MKLNSISNVHGTSSLMLVFGLYWRVTYNIYIYIFFPLGSFISYPTIYLRTCQHYFSYRHAVTLPVVSYVLVVAARCWTRSQMAVGCLLILWEQILSVKALLSLTSAPSRQALGGTVSWTHLGAAKNTHIHILSMTYIRHHYSTETFELVPMALKSLIWAFLFSLSASIHFAIWSPLYRRYPCKTCSKNAHGLTDNEPAFNHSTSAKQLYLSPPVSRRISITSAAVKSSS